MTYVRCHEPISSSVRASELAQDFFGHLLRLPAALFETLLIWQERAAQRTHLASLDDRMLRDMGLSHADVDIEASKPFWRC
ncbi:MAG: DUF1127 domain-containing protein [Kiloniellales bacterium]